MDFVEFKRRILRLAESLLAARPDTRGPWDSRLLGDEAVDVQLDADAVNVRISVTELPARTLCALLVTFREMFGNGPDAVLIADPDPLRLALFNTRRDPSDSVTRYSRGVVRLEVSAPTPGSMPSVRIECPLDEFGDHVEEFVTQTVKRLYPPRPAAAAAAWATPGSPADSDGDQWLREYRPVFEELDCRVLASGSYSLDDLVGLESVSEQLQSLLLRPLERRDLLRSIAERVGPLQMSVVPRGVLLVGPPGCGKTRSMEVIGSAAGIPVVVLPVGAILTKWYGESEQRMRRILGLARRAAPMLLLIDELDAIGRRRSGLDETSSRLVSILLAELDGLQDRGRLAVVAAVNDPELLDSALLDRFDAHITYPEPDRTGRASVLAYYARHLEPGDIEQLADRMDGWSYRRIADYAANVVRAFVAQLDLSRPETHDLPLPTLSDYLAAFDHGSTTVSRRS